MLMLGLIEVMQHAKKTPVRPAGHQDLQQLKLDQWLHLCGIRCAQVLWFGFGSADA